MHKVVLDGTSEHMAYLVQLGKYGAINAVDPTTMGCYMIKYLYEQNTPQEDQTTDEQLINSGELVFKYEYLSLVKYKTNLYCKHHATNQSFIISTHTVFHPYIDVAVTKHVADITRSICNETQALQAVQRQPICIANTYYDYILYKIKRWDHIEYERQIHNEDKKLFYMDNKLHILEVYIYVI